MFAHHRGKQRQQKNKTFTVILHRTNDSSVLGSLKHRVPKAKTALMGLVIFPATAGFFLESLPVPPENYGKCYSYHKKVWDFCLFCETGSHTADLRFTMQSRTAVGWLLMSLTSVQSHQVYSKLQTQPRTLSTLGKHSTG